MSVTQAVAAQPRPADEVLRSHLGFRRKGDVDGDLAKNYAKDVTIIDRHRAYRGHDGVRCSAKILSDTVGDAEFVFDRIATDGRVGYLVWRAVRGKTRLKGVDSFLIEDGRIVGQTIYYHGDEISGEDPD